MQRASEATLFTAFTTAGEMRSAQVDLRIQTSATSELIDVTDHVRAAVAEADIEEGLGLISVPHTTCAVIVNENEPGFAEDLQKALEGLAPVGGRYQHDGAPHDGEDEQPNGYAHIRAAFLSSPSVTLPIRKGMLALGRWQRVFLVELDRARPRMLQITLLGRST